MVMGGLKGRRRRNKLEKKTSIKERIQEEFTPGRMARKAGVHKIGQVCAKRDTSAGGLEAEGKEKDPDQVPRVWPEERKTC